LGTQDTRRIQTKNKTKNTTQFLLDTIMHKTQEGDKQKQKHKTICVGHLYAQTNTNNVNKT